VVKDERGREKLEEVDGVRPGDVLEYRAVYRNVSKQALKGVAANLPLPEGLEYVARTAQPGKGAQFALKADGAYEAEPLIGCAVSTPTSVAGNVSGANNKYNFVVAYTLPATATGTGAYDIGKVTVAPVASSVTAYGYAATNQSVQVQDSVNLTTSAAFSVSKSIGAPNAGIYPPGALTGTWPSAIGNNPSSGSKSVAGASCATTWSTGLASTASCTYITYTISYTNNGAASGRFNLQDVIGTGETAGLTYVTGSAKWSGNANTSAALSESSNSGFTGADFNVATTGSVSTLTFVDGAVAAGGSGSLSFVVLVNSSATKGGDTTSNAVKFNPLDATGANAASPVLGSSPSTSNKSVFLVAGSYGVAVGAASSATSSDAKDATAGTPNATSTDSQSNAKATAGSSTSFTHKVYNLGDDDIVNVTVASSTFPTGTTFRFYKADGTTELSDHNNDGIPDTDTIKGGDVATIVVKAFIPATTAPNAAANYTLTLLGTSVTDATKKDAAKDTLVAVVGAAVDLTNSKTGVSNSGANADVGQGPSAQPTLINASVPAGSWTTLDLWITNNDTQNNTYTLVSSGNSSLSGSLPVGWTVKYVTGAVAKTACAAASGIDPSAISVIGSRIFGQPSWSSQPPRASRSNSHPRGCAKFWYSGASAGMKRLSLETLKSKERRIGALQNFRGCRTGRSTCVRVHDDLPRHSSKAFDACHGWVQWNGRTCIETASSASRVAPWD
ncbi:MAG: hypothetical protein KBC94_17530, partial [Pseudacidovorax sp.]|nr:hypothetical protein [Pseudacidovorax sp.]